jgi:hypothetical protein
MFYIVNLSMKKRKPAEKNQSAWFPWLAAPEGFPVPAEQDDSAAATGGGIFWFYPVIFCLIPPTAQELGTFCPLLFRGVF